MYMILFLVVPQARSCEYTQLLRPDMNDLKRGMLDRMPVADEETIRNRRARFRKDDVREEGTISSAFILTVFSAVAPKSALWQSFVF